MYLCVCLCVCVCLRVCVCGGGGVIESKTERVNEIDGQTFCVNERRVKGDLDHHWEISMKV